MILLRLVLHELAHRWVNTLLALIAVVTAVAMYVMFYTTGEAADRETTRIMRDLGYNLRIIPKETDETQFWAQGYASETMPEEYVQRFATAENISYRHILATLHRQIPAGEGSVLLTGIGTEVSPPGFAKSSMIFTVQPGTIYVGHHAAQRLNVGEGDETEILGRRFRVERCLAETGSSEDVRVYADLAEVQEMLGLEGQINEIQALECLCQGKDEDMIGQLRAELADLLPEAKVIELVSLAQIRQKQRMMMRSYYEFFMQIVLVVCALWLAVLAFLNVRERRAEIGLLHALGYGPKTIAVLVLGKAALIGLAGALLGFTLGTALSLSVGPGIFLITANSIVPVYSLLKWALWMAPLFAMFCGSVPAVLAVTQDPAQALLED